MKPLIWRWGCIVCGRQPAFVYTIMSTSCCSVFLCRFTLKCTSQRQVHKDCKRRKQKLCDMLLYRRGVSDISLNGCEWSSFYRNEHSWRNSLDHSKATAKFFDLKWRGFLEHISHPGLIHPDSYTLSLQPPPFSPHIPPKFQILKNGSTLICHTPAPRIPVYEGHKKQPFHLKNHFL